MKKKLLPILLIGFVFLFLSAIDLPYQVSKLDNPNKLEACGWFFRCGGHKPKPGGGRSVGNSVPEPAAMVILIGGLAGIGIYRYIKNNKE